MARRRKNASWVDPAAAPDHFVEGGFECERCGRKVAFTGPKRLGVVMRVMCWCDETWEIGAADA